MEEILRQFKRKFASKISNSFRLIGVSTFIRKHLSLRELTSDIYRRFSNEVLIGFQVKRAKTAEFFYPRFLYTEKPGI